MKHADIAATVKDLMQEMAREFYIFEKTVSTRCSITPSQWSTLLAFGNAQALKMNELSERMSLATSTMTRMIDSLVKEGLVERTPDFADRRVVMVRLTREGRRLTQKFHKLESEYFSTLLGHIDADIREQVVSALDNLLLAFRKFGKGGEFGM